MASPSLSNYCPLSATPPSKSTSKLLTPTKTHCFFSVPNSPRNSPRSKCQAATSSQPNPLANEGPMSVENLRRFVNLNLGKWNGSCHQFDAYGNLLHKITTKLSASSYGEDELISLNQTLYIKQASSSTSTSGYDDDSEWAEYQIKETNMFTVDKYQQIGFFPKEKAFALRYQTAGMLETVLRQGVLGEDDIGEEFPKNLKLPSRRPALVCESCLYSQERDMRARAFHIMDPKGIIEMFLMFLEQRGDPSVFPPPLENTSGTSDRISPFLGNWKGRSITKRSGVYGATIAEADSVALLDMDNRGNLVQDITTTSSNGDVTTNVHWTGTMSDNLLAFNGGYQITLLPGGMYMGCPTDVSKSVTDSKSFHLEFCWLESSGRRQRLVRTYDVEGLAVSSTYFHETRS